MKPDGASQSSNNFYHTVIGFSPAEYYALYIDGGDAIWSTSTSTIQYYAPLSSEISNIDDWHHICVSYDSSDTLTKNFILMVH